MADPIRIRVQRQGDEAEIKVLINHVMETGLRKDNDGSLVPAHYIQRVSASINDRPVLDAEWSPSVSKNPFIGFKVKGVKADDRITVDWLDNLGVHKSVSSVIT